MPETRVVREIDPSAQVAQDALLGDRCVIGPGVTIGPGTTLGQGVTVIGNTTIGSGNAIGDGCVLGAVPQDFKYAGGDTLLVIGHRNRLGCRVTAHIGTEVGGYLTRIGDENVLSDDCHVAHDCYVDDRTVLAERASLAGHVRLETGAVVGADSGAHHFVTIGRYALIAPRTPVRRDVPPFAVFQTEPNRLTPSVRGANEPGLLAADITDDERTELRQALTDLFEDEAALQTKLEQLISLGAETAVMQLCEFCQRSLRGKYGRYREQFRGQLPPESERYLAPEQLVEARRWMT